MGLVLPSFKDVMSKRCLQEKKDFVGRAQPVVRPTPQPPLIVLRTRPEISDNPSAGELLILANWLISSAQLIAQDVAPPFAHNGTISDTRFQPAIDQLNGAKQYMEELLNTWLQEMRSLSMSEGLYNVQAHYWEIVAEISVIITDTNTLISLLAKKQTSQRWEITKQSNNLATKCSKLTLYFIEN